MSENQTIPLVEVPIGGKDGFLWNRLHEERESICESLLKDYRSPDPELDSLQTRLRKIDDALDRLMAGSYGHCSKCGCTIDQNRLDVDPVLALCLDCWSEAHTGHDMSPESEVRSKCDLPFNGLNTYDTILMRTSNNDYRAMMLDPKTGLALLEGGRYSTSPTEALLRGSSVPGCRFRGGELCVGGRVEIWVNEQVFLTSPLKFVQVLNGLTPVPQFSEAVH